MSIRVMFVVLVLVVVVIHCDKLAYNHMSMLGVLIIMCCY